MTIKVDLLPTERKGFGIDPMMIVLLLVIIGVSVCFAFYSQKLDGDIEDLKGQIAEVEKEIKQIEASLPVLEERRARIRKLKEQIEMIKSLVHDPLRYANLLQEVAVLLPPNVWLTSLSIEPGSQSLQLNGTAAEVAGRLPLATVAQLMRNLNDSRYFKDASLSSTSETSVDPGDLRGFTFQLQVRYDPQAAATLAPTGLGGGSLPDASGGEDQPAPAPPAEGGAGAVEE